MSFVNTRNPIHDDSVTNEIRLLLGHKNHTLYKFTDRSACVGKRELQPEFFEGVVKDDSAILEEYEAALT